MNIERALDRIDAKLDAQDERSAEFREEVLSRLAVLESKNEESKNGWKTLGWIVTFLVSIAALGVSIASAAH